MSCAALMAADALTVAREAGLVLNLDLKSVSPEEIVGFVWAGYADIVPDPPRLPLEQVLRETP